jgi:hypothetical protein
MWKRITDFWLTLDPRSLGAFRILLALLLVRDWTMRWPNLEVFYSSTGVVPLDAPLPRVGGAFHFSLLDATDSLPVLRIVFLLGMACYFLLLIGCHTKLAQILSFLFFASIRTRNPFVSEGGDVVLVTLSLWALFLPLGARWSVDAARAAFRRGIPLRKRADSRSEPPEPPHRSLAAFAIIFQVGLVYLATAAAKTGGTWRDGTAVYYTLQLDSMATPLGLRIGTGPLFVLKLLTWGVLILEWSALPLLLLPIAQPWLRRIAMLGLGSFHVGTILTMVLGIFPWVLLASYALWLVPEEWNRLSRWASRWARPAIAYYDDTCGFCHRCCQLIALADRGRRIQFIGATDRNAWRHELQDAELRSSLIVFDAATGARWTRAAATAALFRALPLPYHICAWLRYPACAGSPIAFTISWPATVTPCRRVWATRRAASIASPNRSRPQPRRRTDRPCVSRPVWSPSSSRSCSATSGSIAGIKPWRASSAPSRCSCRRGRGPEPGARRGAGVAHVRAEPGAQRRLVDRRGDVAEPARRHRSAHRASDRLAETATPGTPSRRLLARLPAQHQPAGLSRLAAVFRSLAGAPRRG